LGASEQVETAQMMLDIAHAMYETTVGSIMPSVGSECIIFVVLTRHNALEGLI